MDAASPALARESVGSPWRTALFRRHCSGAVDGDWPVAVLGPSIAEAIGARSHSVRFSRETAAKQRARHRDIEAEDYARVQRILDEGELFVDRAGGLVGFIEFGGQSWRAIVRTADDKQGTYLRTFHKARPRDLRAARERLVRVSR